MPCKFVYILVVFKADRHIEVNLIIVVNVVRQLEQTIRLRFSKYTKIIPSINKFNYIIKEIIIFI